MQNNFKVYLVLGYSLCMPILLSIDFFVMHCVQRPSQAYMWLHDKLIQQYFFKGPLTILLLYAYPMTVSAVLELRYLKLDNEFQLYSMITALLLLFFIFLLWLAVWLISVNHSRNSDHPLVSKRFGVLFESHSHFYPTLLTLNITSAVLLVMLSRYMKGPLAI